VRTGKTSETLR